MTLVEKFKSAFEKLSQEFNRFGNVFGEEIEIGRFLQDIKNKQINKSAFLSNSERNELIELINSARTVSRIGGKGCGEYTHHIYEFANGEFILFEGRYSSYRGTDYHDCYEVKPLERVITDYVKVEK